MLDNPHNSALCTANNHSYLTSEIIKGPTDGDVDETQQSEDSFTSDDGG